MSFQCENAKLLFTTIKHIHTILFQTQEIQGFYNCDELSTPSPPPPIHSIIELHRIYTSLTFRFMLPTDSESNIKCTFYEQTYVACKHRNIIADQISGIINSTDVISSNDVVLGHPQKRIVLPDLVGWLEPAWLARYTVDRVCRVCVGGCVCIFVKASETERRKRDEDKRNKIRKKKERSSATSTEIMTSLYFQVIMFDFKKTFTKRFFVL